MSILSVINVPANLLTMLLLCNVTALQGCGGSGSTSSSAQTKRLPGDDRVCTLEYAPVCGKIPVALNCVTEPCPTHEFQTFSNQCHARIDEARVAFHDECAGLENRVAFADDPVRIMELSEVPVNVAPVTLLNAEFDGDVVNLTLSYAGGCEPHSFTLFVSHIFQESDPLQANAILTHETDDMCEALLTEVIRVDLLPLQEFHRRAYGSNHGRIRIKDIGLYEF